MPKPSVVASVTRRTGPFGKGATRRLVSIVFEGGESTLDKLAKLSARANKDGKDLVLAVIDRRTDIVYYTLNTQEFKGQEPA